MIKFVVFIGLSLTLAMSSSSALAKGSSYGSSYKSSGKSSTPSYHTKSTKDVSVKGYTKKNGTYVAPYHRKAPNNTQLDNYSTKGNVNPYTGAAGTKDPVQ